MPRRLIVASSFVLAALSALLFAAGCASKPPPPAPKPAPPVVIAPKPPEPEPEILPPVMLGIDVLEADGFKAIAGKKIGLLTHPAGVNRRGESTIDVLRRAPRVKLVALFSPEHGLNGNFAASANYQDSVDAATGLPVISLYTGKPGSQKPSLAQLKGLDALVIDLQDIGVRSYTFSSAMLCAMAGCFEAGIEVIVLDRPNPLGGLKVGGPPLDPELKSYVGAFRVPYMHGLTIGELAKLARETQGVMVIPEIINVSERVRLKGRLTVIPMRGWKRSMHWPDTGLRWLSTSRYITSYEAAVGYALVGLGAQNSGWSSGIGSFYPFRGIGFPKKTPAQILAEFNQFKIPGIHLNVTNGVDREGKVIEGVYVDVSDWAAVRPVELSLYMQKVAAKWSTKNPFAALTKAEARTFKIHVGSALWLTALQRDGAKVDVAPFIKNWTERAAIYQQMSRKFWLYQ